jgi:Holliday junction resolvase RusA-like endonuclease
MMAAAHRASSMIDVLRLVRASVYHPRSGPMKKWMAHAEIVLEQAMRDLGGGPIVPKGGAIRVSILCVFELAKSHHRKRSLPRRSWQTGAGKGDWDNLAKPVCDAANEIVWHDDTQIVRGSVEKIVGRQGEPGRLEILVEPVLDHADHTEFEERLARVMPAQAGSSTGGECDESDRRGRDGAREGLAGCAAPEPHGGTEEDRGGGDGPRRAGADRRAPGAECWGPDQRGFW